MSSTSTTSKTGPPAGLSSSSTTAIPKPIDILPSQIAQLYAHTHPVLLLSVITLSFSNLIRDPVTTLLRLTPVIAALQALYCVLCLPSSGHQTPSAPKPGQKKKSAKPLTDAWSRTVPALLSLILTLTLSTPILSTLVILFGAPLTTHHAHTALLAAHLALLATPQLFYVHGLDADAWRGIASLRRAVDAPFGLALGAGVGAWLGAVPIPLDWDREWQRWPVTVVAGAYGGAVLGGLLGGWALKGKRVVLS